MKIVYYFLLCFGLVEVNAQDFTLTPVDEDVNLKEVPKGLKVNILTKNQKNYLTSKKRDQILNQYVKKYIKDWDELEKDILYKSILNFDKTYLIKKYPFLNKNLIRKLKNAF